MERVIITIGGANAAEKAEAVREAVAELVEKNCIRETNVYIEKQLQVMPFTITRANI